MDLSSSTAGKSPVWQVKQLCSHNGPCRVDEWTPAKVPGEVHLDLMEAGIIDDPFVGLNEHKVQWVSQGDWTYRTEFPVLASWLEAPRLEVVFEGLDTFASVWMNGRQVGAADNMFLEWRFDVRPFVHVGTNLLEIRFESSRWKARELGGFPQEGINPGRQFARKAGYHFGWDWGPTLICTGIWRPVRLEAYSNRITDYWWRWRPEDQTLDVSVETLIPTDTAPTCDLSFAGSSLRATGQKREGSRWVVPFRIDDPKLWWPRGYGNADLYDLTICLQDGSEDAADRREAKVGLRTVELDTSSDAQGSRFCMKVNGVPVFCKGSCWIPGDSFLPRRGRAEYVRDIDRVTKSNQNTLRIWGGGIYEEDCFYDLCDEHGILVFQDFMVACSPMPETEAMIAAIRAEADFQIRRLRRHASLALLAGNNENYELLHTNWAWMKGNLPGRLYYEKLLPEICATLIPDIPYRPSSPYSRPEILGVQEDAHGDSHQWQVFNRFAAPEAYRGVNSRFVSEFGVQAAPHIETVKRFFLDRGSEADDECLDAFSQWMLQRQRANDGQEKLLTYPGRLLGLPRGPEEFVRWSQIAQGLALTVGIEHWRSRWKDQGTSGALVWQTNDCWPVISWALQDYLARPKGGWYFVKRAFEPVLVLAKPVLEYAWTIAKHLQSPTAMEVYMVNDRLCPLKGVLTLETLSLDGARLGRLEQDVEIGANTSTRVGTFTREELRVEALRQCGVRLTFQGDGVQARNDIFFVPDRSLMLGAPAVACRAQGADSWRLTSDRLVRHLVLETNNPDTVLSDNFLTFWPDEEPVVTSDRPDELRRMVPFLPHGR